MANIRLKILEAQYDAMAARRDADQRILARYRQLIEAEYRHSGQATSLNARLQQLRASIA